MQTTQAQTQTTNKVCRRKEKKANWPLAAGWLVTRARGGGGGDDDDDDAHRGCW